MGLKVFAPESPHAALHSAYVSHAHATPAVRAGLDTVIGATSAMFVDMRDLLVYGRANTYGRGETFWSRAPGVSDAEAASRPINLSVLALHVADFVVRMFESRRSMTTLFLAPELHTESPTLRRAHWHRTEYRAETPGAGGLFPAEMRAPFSRCEESTGFLSVTREEHLQREAARALLGGTLMRPATELDALLTDRHVAPVLLSLLMQLVFAALEGRLDRTARVVYMGPVYDFSKICATGKQPLLPNVFVADREARRDLVSVFHMQGGDVSTRARAFLGEARAAGERASLEIVSNDDAVCWAALLFRRMNRTAPRVLLWGSDACVIDVSRAATRAIPDFMKSLQYAGDRIFDTYVALAMLYFDSPYHAGPQGSAQTHEEFEALLALMRPVFAARPSTLAALSNLDDGTVTVDEPALALLWRMLCVGVAGGDVTAMETVFDGRVGLEARWAAFCNLPRLRAPHPLRDVLMHRARLAPNIPAAIGTPQQLAALDATVLALARGVQPVERNLPGLRVQTLSKDTGVFRDGVCFARLAGTVEGVTVRSVRKEDGVVFEDAEDVMRAYTPAALEAAGQDGVWAEHVDAVGVVGTGAPFPGDVSEYGTALAAHTAAFQIAYLALGQDVAAGAAFGDTDTALVRSVGMRVALGSNKYTVTTFDSLDLYAPLQQSGLFLFLRDVSGDAVHDSALAVLLEGSDSEWREHLSQLRRDYTVVVDDTQGGEHVAEEFRPTEGILIRLLLARMIAVAPGSSAVLGADGAVTLSAGPVVVEAPVRYDLADAVRAQPLFFPVTRVTEVDPLVDETVGSADLGELRMPFDYSEHVARWTATRSAIGCPVLAFHGAAVASGLQVRSDSIDWGALGGAYIAALHERVATHARVPVHEICTARDYRDVPAALANVAAGLVTTDFASVPPETRMRVLSFSADVVEHALPLLRWGVSDRAWAASIEPAACVFRGVAQASFDALCRWKAAQDVYQQISAFAFEVEVDNGFTRPWPSHRDWVAAHYALPRIFPEASPSAASVLCPEAPRGLQLRDFSASWGAAALRLVGLDVEARVATPGQIAAAVAADDSVAERVARIAPNVRNLFVRLSREATGLVADVLFVDWPTHAALHYAYWSASQIVTGLGPAAAIPLAQVPANIFALGAAQVLFRWRRAASADMQT